MTFLPGVERNPAPVDSGSHLGPVRIGVLHTTESTRFVPGSTYFGHTSWPHFTAWFDGKRYRTWQHIPLNRAARALKNLAGGVQTNRAGCIQIEVVARAAEPDWPPELVAGVRSLMRAIEARTDIPPTSSVRWVAHPKSFGTKAAQRLTAAQWSAYRGWLGHQHVVENDHGDPGAIDIAELLETTALPQTTEEDDMPLTDEDVQRVAQAVVDRTYRAELPHGRVVEAPVGLMLACSLDAAQRAAGDVAALRENVGQAVRSVASGDDLHLTDEQIDRLAAGVVSEIVRMETG